MAISQNATFFSDLHPKTPSEHPPGESIAGLIRNGLLQRGWRATDLDNWRDCGWVFICTKNLGELQLVLAETATKSNWLLQISPTYVPGLIGSLVGKKSSASVEDIFSSAK